MKSYLIAIFFGAGLGVASAQQMDPSMPMPTEPAKSGSPGSRAGAAMPEGHDMKTMQAPKKPMNSKMGQNMPGPENKPPTPPPPAAVSGPPHAADTVYGSAAMVTAREQLRSEQGAMKAYMVLIDRLETEYKKGGNGYNWDAQAWYGGDINKLWFKTEGSGLYRGKPEQAELQALWSRAVTPFFDLQAGIRQDFAPTPTRTHFALGVQGLMPYSYNLEATLFVTTKGEPTARIKAEYDQRITERLIMQPRVEFNLAAVNMPDIGIGAGLSLVETGLRLRYEFIPEFAAQDWQHGGLCPCQRRGCGYSAVRDWRQDLVLADQI